MGIDTTIPGRSAEIVKAGVAAPFGSAGVVAIVGRFQMGDANKPYYIQNAVDGLNQMGASTSYPGQQMIRMAFTQDPDNDNYGATSAICVRAGATTGASTIIKDTTSTPVTIMTLTVPGGTWGNNLTVTISTGTNSGQKVTIMNGSTIVESWDNCANATEIYNNLLANSSIPFTITVGDLTKTPATVTAQTFTGGAEVSTPTASDIDAALAAIVDEPYDILIFTDLPQDTYYPHIDTYVQNRIAADRLSIPVLPIDQTKTNTQILTLLDSIDDAFIFWLTQTITSNDEILNEAATAARYAGYLAGMPVYESMTNKTISDITAINKDYDVGTQRQLTANGATLLTIKDRQNNVYGVVSAVTGSHYVDQKGNRTMGEQHGIRTLAFCCNYLDVSEMIGDTNFTATQIAIDGEISQRITDLNGIVATDVECTTVYDISNNELLYEDVSVQPFGILKHIHQRINMVNPSVTGA